MIIYKDECVQCPPEKGCIGRICPYRNVPHYICDECGDDVEELYKFEGDELCLDCVAKKLEKVIG